jgi:hypothetical protein
MKDIKQEQNIGPIIETYDKQGGGLLGFTIRYTDGSFENIMRAFNELNYDAVCEEIILIRKLKLQVQ